MKRNRKKTDGEVKQDVLAELQSEPEVNIADIGVLVNDGAVTLNGFVPSYGEELDAVRAAKRVAGVTAIANDIEVKLPKSERRTDGEIAAAAAERIRSYGTIPAGTVGVTVRQGWITLEGKVEWGYQMADAQDAVMPVAGVKGVINLITVAPKPAKADVAAAIRSAFERSAVLDAAKVEVETSGNKVVLRGKVRNHAERDEAERASWAAPGVSSVDNKLKVAWPWDLAA